MQQQLDFVIFSCLNVPYVWGGSNPLTGMDCSGFVIWCMKSVGLWKNGDTTAQGLYEFFKAEGHELTLDGDENDELEEGCLVFFGQSKREITHIGIAVNHELMAEAGGGDSKCTTPAIAAKTGAMVRISPINHRKDLVAAINPFHPA